MTCSARWTVLRSAALLFTVVQTVLAWWALKIGYRFGERTAARVRERFLRGPWRCPHGWQTIFRPAI